MSMAHRRSHTDMFHVAPPPPHHLAPPHHHHAPYPPSPHSPYGHDHHQPRAYPTTPQPSPHSRPPASPSPYHYPRTPQTPHHYPSTPLQSTPNTPHYATPVTPIREYYPSPPAHHYHQQQQPHAGPSRPPPPPTYRNERPPSTQYVYRHPQRARQQQQYPQSAPPRIMQDWSSNPAPGAPAAGAGQQTTPIRNGSGSAAQPDASEFDLVAKPSDPTTSTFVFGAPDSAQGQPGVSENMCLHWYGPQTGRSDTEVCIYIMVPCAPFGAPHRAFRAIVGRTPVATHLSGTPNVQPTSPSAQMITLWFRMPPLHTLGMQVASNRTTISCQMLHGEQVIETLFVGDFTYVNPNASPHRQQQNGGGETSPAKRQAESHPLEAGSRSWRPGPQAQAQAQTQDTFTHHRAVSTGDLQQYNYAAAAASAGNTYTAPPSRQQQQHQQQLQVVPYSAPASTAGYMTSSGEVPSVMGPAYTLDDGARVESQPALIRASQLNSVPIRTAAWYRSNRADCVFQNDLLSMCRGWSPEEWLAKRRLVKVWRRQIDSQIFMAFRPVPYAEYPLQKGSVIVSCIFREDRNACFITSVDIIYLLEAVIGQRFTIEEKNRIRRNLEGFRPQTCSKSKAGSEDFFKTVMAFPSPKPRNIEKDLKVFAWDVLPDAVRKIVSKYTTAGGAPGASPGMIAVNGLPAEFAPCPHGGAAPPPLTAEFADAAWAFPAPVQPENQVPVIAQPEQYAPAPAPQPQPQGRDAGLGLGVQLDQQPQQPRLTVDTDPVPPAQAAYYGAYTSTPQVYSASPSAPQTAQSSASSSLANGLPVPAVVGLNANAQGQRYSPTLGQGLVLESEPADQPLFDDVFDAANLDVSEAFIQSLGTAMGDDHSAFWASATDDHADPSAATAGYTMDAFGEDSGGMYGNLLDKPYEPIVVADIDVNPNPNANPNPTA